MLLLALVATVPGVAYVAGLLLMIPAFEMIAGPGVPELSTRHRRSSLSRLVTSPL